MPAMSSPCSTRSAIVPLDMAIGNITAPVAMTAAVTADDLVGLAHRRMTQAKQMAKFMQRHKFQIDARGRA